MKAKLFVVPIGIILFGLLFFAIGSGLSWRQHSLEDQGTEAQGTVVGLQESCDEDGCTYAPVVEFNTRDGQSVKFTSTYYSSPPSYKVGEAVVAVYQIDNPSKAVIKGEGQLFHSIFMLVGGGVALFGFYQIYVIIRNRVVAS